MRTANMVNIIFGMKVRQARLEAGLSVSQFAIKSHLSPSYVTEIEKGRKYPKSDKIMRMAGVLGKDYDDLVSIKLDPSLSYLEGIISSPLLHQFPFEEFDVEIGDLLNLFTRAPDKISALLHAILDIGRQYDMKEEHFLRAALRSYQEIHENYFEELEIAATKFADQYKLLTDIPVSLESLRELITKEFGYALDDTQLAQHKILSGYRSVFIRSQHPRLLLNASLQPRQIKFLLARELGYQYLEIKERSDTSSPDKVDSFEQVLNDFRASYFAGALLMPPKMITNDLQNFFAQKTWQQQPLIEMLIKYDVTPEMLLYRFSELIPEFFGKKLHFLRFHNANNNYQLVKQLNLNNLHLPNGLSLRENHCRRWLSIQLLKEMSVSNSLSDDAVPPIAGAQISTFLNTNERFLDFGFARPLALSPALGSSVAVGFRLESGLEKTIRFVEDPALPHVIISETCERCPLHTDQCSVRAAPPTMLELEQQRKERNAALNQLMAQMQK